MAKDNPRASDSKYQRAINDIFDYIRHVCFLEGISLKEGLGILDDVKGSLKITLAKQSKAQYEAEEEEEEYDDEE